MLLLDSRTLWQRWGAPGAAAGQEVGAGALVMTKLPVASLRPCLAPSPALATGLPLLALSRTASPCQPCMA